MSALAKDISGGLNKTKARYLVALKNVLDRDQIRQSVILFDELCASGVNDVTPEDFGAVIASRVPGTAGIQVQIVAALDGRLTSESAGAPSAVPVAANIGIVLQPPTAVFNAILNSVMQQVSEKNSSKSVAIVKKLPRELAVRGLIPGHESAFNNWAESFEAGQRGQLTADLPTASITSVMDVLYTIVCDSYGPQFTDKAVGQAMVEAEKLPEAKQYSPRQLL